MRNAILFAAALAVSAGPLGAATIKTFGNVATGAAIYPFGPAPSASPTYGQVFFLPQAGMLKSFTFNLTGGVGQISAGIGTWTGGLNDIESGGSPTTLWHSGLVASGPGAITFTPNVDVDGLTKYVAYITVYDSPDAAGQTSLLLGDNGNSALRYFVFDNGTGNPSGNSAWNYYDTASGDALFSLSLSVPEPAEWALMIFGFSLIGAVARRRRSGLALAA